jgi:hypothetical protein
MLSSIYLKSLFITVCRGDVLTLQKMYSLDGNTYVLEAHRLFRMGLITGNFIYGGDAVEPLDITGHELLMPTSCGIRIYEKMLA